MRVAAWLIVIAAVVSAAAQEHGAMTDNTEAARAAARVLDDFHDAASKADGARYFAHFAPDGVFLGTDDTERWTVAEFRAYAEPYFSKGKGWTYTVADRHVALSPDGRVAWFDERLDNAKLGRCRGSGVLLWEARAGGAAGAWRIAQYNLTIPIPNALAEQVAGMIREDSAKNPAAR